MIIKKITLVNFRSHEHFVLDFHKKTTMITGENGCGKTSVLEAIFEALRGKSFKAVDKEILKKGTDFYRVEIEFNSGEKTTVFYDLNTQKKSFQVADRKTSRLPVQNRYPVVLFVPSDLNLVSSSPTSKRAYFDNFFGQLSDSYNTSLAKYNKALKQRNELLKEEYLREDALFPWDIMLVKYGAEIVENRKKLVEKINTTFTKMYQMIAENQDEVKLLFKTQVENDEKQYLSILQREYQRDRILGHTGFGIHRDDYEFYFNSSLADGTASRGETRSIVLALKFIEATILEQKQGKKPLILLDDVFSELDETRRRCLARNFKNNQVIITSVEQPN